MEFFNKAKEVRFRSYHDKYLIADEDQETVRQSRDGTSTCARWVVEFVPGVSHLIRLKSCYGKYLTASDEPCFLDFTGKKVIQDMATSRKDTSMEWEPLAVGFQVKLRARSGKFLRANGGTPPWRNSVTHDVPHRPNTQSWVFWDVDVLEILVSESIPHHASPATSISSHDVLRSESWDSNFSLPFILSTKADPIFQTAESVRLRSYHEKYLLADEDEENVIQDWQSTIRNARWTVELVDKTNVIRLKSCYGKYLTASNLPCVSGMQGKKVLQTLPGRLDSSVEWEAIREGAQFRLKTRHGRYLRANEGIPPWRNNITHDTPDRTSKQDSVLWEVDITEIRPSDPSSPPPPRPSSPPAARQFNEGRTIYYCVANEHGETNEDEELSFNFKGSVLDELKQKLEMETGMNDVLLCFRNPLNEKLYPLKLNLPPSSAEMNVVVVPSSGKEIISILRLFDFLTLTFFQQHISLFIALNINLDS
ncbi:hypothetical protein K2173_020301 [Erythroxylum novogranatense]|uniref:Actin cross-linking n=1 Tax=Erythroxylum novogranatense TaxID=1862640 RepID=A0AAV8U7J7_9ROSI|nr:hypothetical protein K2173_020301 [Erythroxylum novogranatense]